MTNPILVGLTGGIGSGKSTVAKVFEILKVPVYYADDRGKWLLANDPELKRQVIQHFGKESYLEDESLNRVFLAKEVFPDPKKLSVLNALVHPAVGEDFTAWVEKNSQAPYVIKEAALIFETESYKSLDKVVCVMAPKAVRVQRVLLRDLKRPEEQVHQIIDKQVSDGKRKKLSYFLVANSGKESIIDQVISLHKALLSAGN